MLQNSGSKLNKDLATFQYLWSNVKAHCGGLIQENGSFLISMSECHAERCRRCPSEGCSVSPPPLSLFTGTCPPVWGSVLSGLGEESGAGVGALFADAPQRLEFRLKQGSE